MKITSETRSHFTGKHKGFTFYVVVYYVARGFKKYHYLTINDQEGIPIYFGGRKGENTLDHPRKEDKEIVDEIIQYVKVRVRLLS